MRVRLLAAQRKMLLSTSPYTCMVAGYGSGKSFALVHRAFNDAIKNPQGKVAVYAPTYDLLDLLLIPRFTELLDNCGIAYVHNKSKYTIACEGIGNFIFRSLNNPERIVGYETVSAHIDELDTLSMDKAELVWNKVLARNRSRNTTGVNNVFAYTTPEGLNFCYQTWGKEKRQGYRLIKARTEDNPYLPPDYVANLKANYPERLVKAYLEGEFCSLSDGLVYYNYDEVLNESKIVPKAGEIIRVGMDFNIGKMSAVAGVYRNGKIHIFSDITDGYDTRDMINKIKNSWGNNCIIYPDASGGNRSTSSSVTDLDLLKEHFRVRSPNQNPRVRDRVNTVVGGLCNANGDRNILINRNCVSLIEALENQAYDKRGEPDKTTGFDHLNDAMGYMVWGLIGEKSGVKRSGIRFY